MGLNVIGISAYYHNAACCLIQDGSLVCAAEEERFSRIKHDPRLPVNSFRFCLDQGNITVADVDCVAFYENPVKKLSRQIWTVLLSKPTAYSRKIMASVISSINRVQREIKQLLGYDEEIEFVDHHQAHAASSYYFSGFPEAAIFTTDGVGEWATTTYGTAKGNHIELFEEVHFPDSIGLLYSTITAYLGFEVNDGEYKVMGLAPYGKPRFVEKLSHLIELQEAGQYHLNMNYFDFLKTERMYSEYLTELLGAPPRKPESALLDFHKDVARSLQIILEDILLKKTQYLYQRVPGRNLCMAGGVALNCVANTRILRDSPFSNLFVQPAANDAGGALGAAAIAYLRKCGSRPPLQASLEHVFLGPGFTTKEIARLFQATDMHVSDFRGKTDALLNAVVEHLAAGKVVGWFCGRMEFGPRALGARSILADPRDPGMRERINALVKKRESFRPFAPAVLWEKAQDYFTLDHPSPFMLETCQVISKDNLPAITHVDGSARVQTVHKQSNPRFASLLEKFGHRTGCYMLLNTSFNMRGEPIVCSPVDAIVCFIRSNIDLLVLEDFLIEKEHIPPLWNQFVTMMPLSRSVISKDVYAFL